LGYCHADVSAALLQKWGLPLGLIRPVLFHHERVESLTATMEEQGWLQAMQVAEAVADLKDQATPHRQRSLKRYVATWGRMDEGTLRNCLLQAVTKTNELGQLFNVAMPNEAEMQRLIAELASEADMELEADSQLLPELRRRIVVLHDDASALQTIEEWLHGTEFELIAGGSPDDMREAARTADAILCDVNLDTEQGTDIVLQLRREGARAPVFVISADRSRRSVIRSLEAGACEYILKPLDRDRLLTKLRERLMVV
jgi:CheY-like chemotaxis protein